MSANSQAGVSPLRLFIPITKIDIEKQLVYGVATAEQEDRAGEICDYASTKPYYQAWSADIAKNTGGKSKGNLRSMHQKIAAGKVTELDFDDDKKAISICAKVVDEAEWEKVKEGVYTGFSQGGRYVKRWDDASGKTRYTADPMEVSLVDLPCLPSATFSVVKAAGQSEIKTFKSVVKEPSAKAVMDYAYELAKFANLDNPTDAQFNNARATLLAKALIDADAEIAKTEKVDAAVAGAIDQAIVEKTQPTDEDIDERALEIAASDGATSISDAHRAKARAELTQGTPVPIQEILGDSVREIVVPQGNAGNGATSMTVDDGITLKADDAGKDEPVQGFWDGEAFHVKKKDAAKAIKDRKVAKALAEVTGPVNSVLFEINKALGIAKLEYSAEPSGTVAERTEVAKDAMPSHGDRMAQHKAMMAFHASQDGEGHMKAAASHAEAYMAHSAGSDDAEDKTKQAFQASRDCIGGACKDAGEADLLKTAGFVAKDAMDAPMVDKAALHASMANFHAKMSTEAPAETRDKHRAAAGAHAAAHIAHATGAEDAEEKSAIAFGCTKDCMGPMKALEVYSLHGVPIAKADEPAAAEALRQARKTLFGRLGKGLPTVARLACLIEELKWVLTATWMEAKQENDNSPLPMKLKADLASLCETLVAMTTEETRELMDGQNVDDLYTAESVAFDQGIMASARVGSLIKFMAGVESLAEAGKALAKAHAGELNTSIAALTAAVGSRGDLAKAGRRTSAADMARAQKVHDLATELGANCGDASTKAVHVSGGETLEKLETLNVENATLKANLADYGAQLTKIFGEVEKLKASPVPAKAALFAVAKDLEAARATGSETKPTDEAVAEMLGKMSKEQIDHLLMKGALSRPVRHVEA